MLASSLVGGVLVTAMLVTMPPDAPGGGSTERGYQRAVAKFRQGAFDQSLRDT